MRLAIPGLADRFVTASLGDAVVLLTAPALTLEGRRITCALSLVTQTVTHELEHGVTETRHTGPLADALPVTMTAVVRQRSGSPFARFRYELDTESSCRIGVGADTQPEYLSLAIGPDAKATAVRLGEFEESVHSYHLTERPIRAEAFTLGFDEAGPILAVECGGHTALLGYEHGATAPDTFLKYEFISTDGGVRSVRLVAVKGNVPGGTDISRTPFQTVWFQVGLVDGGLDACAAAYRSFVLRDMSPNTASRSPWVFYNTWNYQERNKHWHGKDYLDSMRQERMVQEIDVAGRMGIDTFVLDTGWYAKTGEWAVNPDRFDADLATLRKMLTDRGMKLGLWFSPGQSAVSAEITQAHLDCRCESDGKPWDAHPVWETEESYHMCLASRWWEAFADELIRLHREVGVTYFKWDAIQQYGCESPNHSHGMTDNTPQERRDCAAFEQVRYMAKIVDKVCASCP
ncbi:alpha-galactosidase, partial [Verrucomicrobiota bacterium]